MYLVTVKKPVESTLFGSVEFYFSEISTACKFVEDNFMHAKFGSVFEIKKVSDTENDTAHNTHEQEDDNLPVL